MGLIELFEKSRSKAKSKDELVAKLITVKTYDDESLLAFFDQYYPDEASRKEFLKKHFTKIYPLYRSPLLSTIFGMTSEALRKTASRKGIKKAEYWSEEEDEFLKKNYELKTNKELQEYLNRTKWAIISRYQILTGKR